MKVFLYLVSLSLSIFIIDVSASNTTVNIDDEQGHTIDFDFDSSSGGVSVKPASSFTITKSTIAYITTTGSIFSGQKYLPLFGVKGQEMGVKIMDRSGEIYDTCYLAIPSGCFSSIYDIKQLESGRWVCQLKESYPCVSKETRR